MEQFWRKKNFKDIYKEWNKKLKDSGFEDVEEDSKDTKEERLLKQKSTNAYRQASELERESRLDYFCFVGYLAHNTVFPTDLEKLVMIRHSEGAMIKNIVDEIASRGISRDRKTIRHIIRRWQTKWGIKSWSLREMNLKE